MNIQAIPAGLELWTADEIAECLDGLSELTYRELWKISDLAENKKPLGGDGSDGTVEWPEVTDEYDNQPNAFWAKLSDITRADIIRAFNKHNADFAHDADRYRMDEKERLEQEYWTGLLDNPQDEGE